jgi:hypothetical protein
MENGPGAARGSMRSLPPSVTDLIFLGNEPIRRRPSRTSSAHPSRFGSPVPAPVSTAQAANRFSLGESGRSPPRARITPATPTATAAAQGRKAGPCISLDKIAAIGSPAIPAATALVRYGIPLRNGDHLVADSGAEPPFPHLDSVSPDLPCGRSDAGAPRQLRTATAAAIMASFGSANVRDRGKVLCRSSVPAYALSRRKCGSARTRGWVRAGSGGGR